MADNFLEIIKGKTKNEYNQELKFKGKSFDYFNDEFF
jgi:hypothetical protein